MALTQVLLFCLGLTVLVKQGEAQPGLTTTSISVAENTAAGTVVGQLVHSGSPASITLAGLPMTGMLTATVNGANIDYTLATGFSLNYDTGTTSFTFESILVDGATPAVTATVTTTLVITDVTDEYTDPIMYTCISGYSAISAGTTLATPLISSGVTSAYTITAESPSLSLTTIATASTGVITVASGKTIDPRYIRSLSLSLQSVSTSSPVVTSVATLVVYFGSCSSTSSAASVAISTIALFLAALIAKLQ